MTSIQSAVAACLLDGMSDKEIAKACGIPYWRAQDEVQGLMKQFLARNRTALAVSLAYYDLLA